jgi:hypothetical protein
MQDPRNETIKISGAYTINENGIRPGAPESNRENDMNTSSDFNKNDQTPAKLLRNAALGTAAVLLSLFTFQQLNDAENDLADEAPRNPDDSTMVDELPTSDQPWPGADDRIQDSASKDAKKEEEETASKTTPDEELNKNRRDAVTHPEDKGYDLTNPTYHIDLDHSSATAVYDDVTLNVVAENGEYTGTVTHRRTGDQYGLDEVDETAINGAAEDLFRYLSTLEIHREVLGDAFGLSELQVDLESGHVQMVLSEDNILQLRSDGQAYIYNKPNDTQLALGNASKPLGYKEEIRRLQQVQTILENKKSADNWPQSYQP